jgi:Fur family transcriptional regulator, ferric uptake regulator
MPTKLKTRRETRAREQLNRVGLKATTQRLWVLHILRSHERRHLTAEEVHQRITEQSGHVGLATVYRVLGQLTGVGIVARHVFNGESGKAVYEVYQGNPHDHLICLECERVEEFADDTIVERSRSVAEARGYAFSQHQLALYGYCSQCRARSGRARA